MLHFKQEGGLSYGRPEKNEKRDYQADLQMRQLPFTQNDTHLCEKTDRMRKKPGQ